MHATWPAPMKTLLAGWPISNQYFLAYFSFSKKKKKAKRKKSLFRDKILTSFPAKSVRNFLL